MSSQPVLSSTKGVAEREGGRAEVRRVAFYMVPEAGHLYPTLALAKQLVALGIDVVYIGGDRGAKIIEPEGLRYIRETETGRYLAPSATPVEPAIQSDFGEKIATFSSAACRLLVGLKVDLLFLDALIEIGSLVAADVPLPVYHLCVFNYPCYGDPVPPPSSDVIPSTGAWYRIRIQWAWLGILLEIYGLTAVQNLRGRRRWANTWLLTRRIRTAARKTGRPWKLGWHGPILALPQLILGPKELDFEYGCKAEYLGFCIDHSRVQTSLAIDLPSDKKSIFCSFGMQINDYGEDRLRKVYALVVEVFARRPDLHLVLQIPQPLRSFRLPPNVTCVGLVSSLQMTAKVYGAIIHGGYGLLKECVDAGVPMVVIPFKYDQPGNAARVHHHGIGVQCALRGLTTIRLEAALEAILDPAMKARTQELGKRIRGNYDLEAFARRVRFMGGALPSVVEDRPPVV